MSNIQDRIDRIRGELQDKLVALGRKADDCLLLAVSKTRSPEEIIEALAGGIVGIGENKVQEAAAKLPLLRTLAARKAIDFEFHFIGHLQRNKVKQLLKLRPDLIHSVDSLALAEELSKQIAARGDDKGQDILLQVNCSGELSKGGFEPSELVSMAAKIAELPGLRIRGLMTIGLLADEPEEARLGFRTLKELYQMLKADTVIYPALKWLSMGMSDDYHVALEEGSNLVRIGTAIFGHRNYGAGL